jgi:hypothetical protein
MKRISIYWILHNNWVLCNNDYFKLGLLYNWTLDNKLKASILITFINQFYYRMLYNYFDED